tara:strand:+ start:1592 stop:6175 length:4584 start_codon:yes stop_codon:yes gene_type:complete
MTSLFDVGKSGIQAYRQSLAVTGQNIANLNTDGYMRREADLQEVTASQGGITSLSNQAGLGVRVANINRSFNAFLLDRARMTTSGFQHAESYLNQLKQLEDMLLPSEADLGSQIGRFFGSLGEVGAAPGDLAPRVVAIEEGDALASSFNALAGLIDRQKSGTISLVDDAVNGLNILANELAGVNSRILSAGQSGQSPNSLLDLRDRLIDDLAKFSDITVAYSDRGVASVSLGPSGVGPTLVDKSMVVPVGHVVRDDVLQFVLNPGGASTPTSQITSGVMAGLVDAFSMTMEVKKDVNHLAGLVSSMVNNQHKLGVDLDGNPGGNMFSTNGLLIEKSQTNISSLVVELDVTDISLLPDKPVTITYNSKNDSWDLTGENIKNPISGQSQILGPGFIVNITGSANDGDFYTLSPDVNVASNIKFLLRRPQEIAAASANMVSANNNNISEAELLVDRNSEQSSLVERPISDILLNSQSPVVATEFLKDGLVATIPAGTKNVELSSFSKQASARFLISDAELKTVNQLKFELENTSNNGPHIFNVSYSTANPNAPAGETWSSPLELAKALNNGVLRSNNNLSLADVGIYLTASSGTMTMAVASGKFKATGVNQAQISSGSGTLSAVLTDEVAASNIHIFTREGRHLAGSGLTLADIDTYINSANGFSSSAVYVGDYLNRSTDMYRGAGIKVLKEGGHHKVTIGSNGTGAAALGANAVVPSNVTVDREVKVALSNGEERIATVPAGSSASDAAERLNASFNEVGVRANAELTVELFSFQTSGQVAFELASSNLSPVKIESSVGPSNLSSLAVAINRKTVNTGVEATVSIGKDRIFLDSKSGEDIVFKNLNNGAPIFSSRVIGASGEAVTPILLLGGSGEGVNNAARFSGVVEVSSSDSFSLNAGSGSVNSIKDEHLNSLVSVSGTTGGESKTISYTVNGDIDSNAGDFQGLKAAASGAIYSLTLPVLAAKNQVEKISGPTVPTIAAGDKFKVTINGTDIETAAATNQANLADIVSMLNTANAAPLVPGTFSVDGTDDIIFTYTSSGPVSGTISKLLFNDVSLGGGYDAGSGNGAQAVLGVSSISYSASVDSSSFSSINKDALNKELLSKMRAQAPIISLSGGQIPATLPADGDSVTLSMAGDLFKLTMKGNEVVITGGEAGRLEAYFDSARRLQVFGGGVLSGDAITLTSDSIVGNNAEMAKKFGLSSRISRVSSQQFTLNANLPTLNVEFNGTPVAVNVANNGAITKTPNLADLSLSWQPSSGSTGRLIAEFDSSLNSLSFKKPQDGVGFKVSELTLKLSGDVIQVDSTSGNFVEVEAAATSLAKQTIEVLGGPQEDLIVLVTGAGARSIGSVYDAEVQSITEEPITVEISDSNSRQITVLDLMSGHSIATRQLDENGMSEFSGYGFELRGTASKGDRFTIEANSHPAGDNRNLNKILTFQVSDTNGPSSGGFQKVFNAMVAGVGAAVNSNRISHEAAEANRDAATEAKSEFSGVNLDTEAAALLEYQQAYQASARVLSTARELFQALMDVV